MNKYVYIAMLALACTLALAQPIEREVVENDDAEAAMYEEWDREIEEAESQAMSPTNDEETAGLSDSTKGFSDFCTTSRDYVTSSIRRNVQGLAADAFGLFFRSANTLVQDTIEVQKSASDILGNQLRNPSAPITEGEGRVGEIIAEGQTQIRESSQPTSLYKAFLSTLAATKESLTQAIGNNVAAIQKNLKFEVITNATKEICEQVNQYEAQIREQFEAAKKGMSASNPGLALLKFEDVNCLTAKRVTKINGFCQFVGVAQGPVMKMLSFQPKN